MQGRKEHLREGDDTMPRLLALRPTAACAKARDTAVTYTDTAERQQSHTVPRTGPGSAM